MPHQKSLLRPQRHPAGRSFVRDRGRPGASGRRCAPERQRV